MGAGWSPTLDPSGGGRNSPISRKITPVRGSGRDATVGGVTSGDGASGDGASRPYESAVDRAVREAAERGAFDGLPGRGKPLPHLDDTSEDWWLRGYLEREGISRELLLPPSVQLRKELDRLPATLDALRTEAEVRAHVREVNRRVVEHLRFPSGPRVPVHRVDVDEAVAGWAARRAPATPEPPGTADAPADPPRRRWWPWRRR